MRRQALAVIAAASTVLITACGSSLTSWKGEGSGWPSALGDARNSATSDVAGARALTATWSRPLGGTVTTPASISSDGQIFVTADVTAGCNLLSFQMRSGRKRFCNNIPFTKPVPDPIRATPIVDGNDNIYVGIADGTMRSYNDHGQERWVMPVFGTPLSAQFTGDGNVLVVTQAGQINVFERQTGKTVVAPLRLMGEPDRHVEPDLAWPPADQGLAECGSGASGCPVANAPAVDPRSGRFFVTAWLPQAKTASLIGLRYGDGKLTQDWAVPILTGGSTTNPAISADGDTVYVGNNVGDLIAVNADNGATRWTQHLGYLPSGGMSVSADGLIIPGGAGALTALRDKGDHADPAWQRQDLIQQGVPAQTAGSTGYAVVHTAADPHPALVTFNTDTGATLGTNPLPDATGPATGTSVGPHGEVLVATRAGALYAFTKS